MAEANRAGGYRTERLETMYADLSGRCALVGNNGEIRWISPSWRREACGENTLVRLVGASAAEWVAERLESREEGCFRLCWRNAPCLLVAKPTADGLALELKNERLRFPLETKDLARAERELRETLSILIAAADSVRGAGLNEKARINMALLRKELFHMIWITEAVSDLRKREQRQIKCKMKKENVADIAKNVADRLSVAAESLEVKMETWIPRRMAIAAVDRRQVERMLYTVASISLKHACLQGVLRFVMNASEENIRFSLSDRDMGLKYMTDNRKDGEEEKSMELMLARTLAEAHGGRVMVEADVSGWSTVHIYLPINQRSDIFSTMRMEYGGGFDTMLVELSSVLPRSFYE